MSSLSIWNPFREMDDLLTRYQRGYGRLAPSAGAAAVTDWAPSVDIAETEKEYTIKADLAGVKKEDVKVDVQNGVLTLSGERKFEKEEKDKKHHRVERAYGSFTRSFSLPENVAEDKITAECKDGVVNICLPKADIKAPKTSQIKVQ
jgi:HSP20 family protein